MIRLVLIAIPVLCASVAADTIKVSSGVADDLQAAIDDASPGDVISVSGGPYEGTFTIPVGKDGLTIKGKATIDAQGGNSGFMVDSHGVVLSGLTVRHAMQGGVEGPAGGGPSLLLGLSVEKCRFVDCGAEAVEVTGDDVLVSGCVAEGCRGGVHVVGERAVVTTTSVLNDGAAGVLIEGGDAQVSKCVLTNIDDGDAISIIGSGGLVSGCKVSHAANAGILVSGPGATVSGNTVADIDGRGLDIEGDGSEVTKNKVKDTGDEGIRVSGLGVIVTRNSVDGVRDDDDGFAISSDSGALIEANTAVNTSEDGFSLSVTFATVIKNKAVRCGTEEDAGIYIFGNDNLVENNTVQDCDQNGFLVCGDGNTLNQNMAVGNHDNGFLVDGLGSTDNVLDGNSSTGNEGEGIQNRGTGTVLRNNKCSKNLLDIANETSAGASIIDGGGNKVTTGADFTTEPKISG